MAKKQVKRMPRRREEFTYHGYTIPALQEMSINDLIPIMPCRARRKMQRGMTRDEENLLEKIRSGDEKIRTHSRAMVILPEMVGKTIEIYTGKEFQRVEIPVEGVFHYLGEFAQTRRKISHGSAGIGATRSSKYVPLK
jgi:SSU ribosomal protein S19P